MRTARTFCRYWGVVLLVVLLGCRSRELHDTITIIPRNTAEAFSVTEHAGAAEAARKLHVHLYWNGPSSDSNVEQQIALMGLAINMGTMGMRSSKASTTSMALTTSPLSRALLDNDRVTLPPSTHDTAGTNFAWDSLYWRRWRVKSPGHWSLIHEYPMR